MNLAKKLAEDFVDPDGEIVAQARREKQNKAVDIKPAVIKPNPSFASKMSDTMNAYSGDKKDTTRDSSSEMSSSLRPRANPRLASDTATTSTNVDTTPKKEISGDQLAQIGASELNTPKVRTALQDPNKPTAGLASGLKAAAEKAVAAREPAPEVDRDRQGETARPAEPTKPAETSSDYTIQKGDNLTKLAKQNNTTIDAIMKANPQIKDPNLIYAGSKLKMPSVSESVEFSAEELAHIKSVMEAMPVAPTDPGDSPNPTTKKKAEGSRSKGSLAD
jgi:LysM repeat protein